MNRMTSKRSDESIILRDGREITYVLDRGVRKNMYLCIRDGQIVLKVPVKMSDEQARDFLLSKTQWIEKNIDRRTPSLHGFVDYADGETIDLLGKSYVLRLVDSTDYQMPFFSGGQIIVTVNVNTQTDRIKLSVDKLINDFADKQIQNSFKRLCSLTGLYPQKVTVKNMTSSWGRCSSDKKISINRSIVFHPQECVDYVIIHELCHLVFMDHSKDFWNLVERYCPDRKRIRKLLNG